MDATPTPFASLLAAHVQRPQDKQQKRRMVQIVPIELSIERGFYSPPRRRWNPSDQLQLFAKSFAIFFVATMVFIG